MKYRGIRICDDTGGSIPIVSVKLSDILGSISNGDSLNWAILFSDVMPKRENAETVMRIGKEVKDSENGLEIKWKDLILFSEMIFQEIDLIVIGCKEKKDLHQYASDSDRNESCDIVIEMIDSSYWEVYSRDRDFIDQLSEKFKSVEQLKCK